MSKRRNRLKRERLKDALDEFDILAAYDHEILQLSHYHFRINRRLDVWPSTQKAYDILSHEKFTYDDLVDFVMERFQTGRITEEFSQRKAHLSSIE